MSLYFVKSPAGYSYNDIGHLAAYPNLLAIVTLSKGELSPLPLLHLHPLCEIAVAALLLQAPRSYCSEASRTNNEHMGRSSYMPALPETLGELYLRETCDMGIPVGQKSAAAVG